MVFRKMLSALGVNAPSVDTVLAETSVNPGCSLTGHINLRGGAADVQIEHLNLHVVTRLEQVEATERSWANPIPVATHTVAADFTLPAGADLTFSLSMNLPWETPLTHVSGRAMRGARAAIHTELAVGKAIDKSDLDELAVHPIPEQRRLLDSFAELGFRIEEAEVKHGRVRGGHRQKLPYWQEVELIPSAEYLPKLRQLEIAFIARADGLDLITGRFGPYSFPLEASPTQDYTAWLDAQLRRNFPS